MDTTPKIIIKDNYGIDETGKLNSVTIPATVDTIQGPAEVTTYATTINWVPSTADKLTKFSAPNITQCIHRMFKDCVELVSADLNKVSSISVTNTVAVTDRNNNNGTFKGCSSLSTINLDNCTQLSTTVDGHGRFNGVFYGCTGLERISMPKLTVISDYSRNNDCAHNNHNGCFCDCSSLKSIDMPLSNTISNDHGTGAYCGTFAQCYSLTNIKFDSLLNITGRADASGGAFNRCSGLKTVILPVIKTIINYSFSDCTGLKSITLGSYQNPVTSLGTSVFSGVTASDITVKIWTSDGNALPGSPYGLTGVETIKYFNSHYPEEEQTE